MDKVKIYLVFFIGLLLMAGYPFAAEKQDAKKYFETLLYDLCLVGDCSKKLTPNNAENAKEIVFNSLYYAKSYNYEKLKRLKVPNSEVGDYSLIPQNLLNEYMCKYYGIFPGDSPAITKALQEYKGPSGFYQLADSDAGADAPFEIKTMQVQNNDILYVTGMTGYEDEMKPFKAYFKKTNCGGKQYWVLEQMTAAKK